MRLGFAAIEELEVQSEILDAMSLGSEAVVVMHIGGVGGDKTLAKARFEAAYLRLSERAQARLVIENDDRSFGLSDVWISRTGSGVRLYWTSTTITVTIRTRFQTATRSVWQQRPGPTN